VRLARLTIEALAGGELPAGWADDTVVLLGSGRVRPDPAQAAESPLVKELPVFG
jgi:hypothetical protein